MLNRCASVKAFSLLLIIVVLSSLAIARASTGWQKADLLTCTSLGTLIYGLAPLPIDYSNCPAQKYLLIILPGRGGTANGITGSAQSMHSSIETGVGTVNPAGNSNNSI